MIRALLCGLRYLVPRRQLGSPLAGTGMLPVRYVSYSTRLCRVPPPPSVYCFQQLTAKVCRKYVLSLDLASKMKETNELALRLSI